MWQLVQPQCIFFHMFFFNMKGIGEESQYCYVSKFDLAALCVCVFVFVFKSSPTLLKPSAWSPHSLCWSGPLGPPCPPALCQGAPPPHPGSPPPAAFSSSLHPLILRRRRLLLVQSPPRLRPPPPPRPLCPGWLSQCRWMKGKKACGVAQPGWEPGD